MESNGIFFINAFDTGCNSGESHRRTVLLRVLRDLALDFNLDKDFVMLRNNNTAISFCNVIRKPENFEGHWTYEVYKSQKYDKNYTFNRIFYGWFEDGNLTKIYQISHEAILEAFEDKMNRKKDTERYNISKNILTDDMIIWSTKKEDK